MKINGRLIFITLTAALGGFLFGFDTAVIAGATSALEKLFSLDKFWLGFTVSIALIGTIIGTVVVGKPADLYGRRRILFHLAIFYALSALGCAFSFSWESLLFFRFLGGIAVGGVSVVGPMYIADFLAVSIAMFNQLSGINGLLYYLNDIFAQAGFSKVSGDLQSMAIGATNLLFTMLAMSIIDKVGRKLLLLIGSIGTAVSLAGVAFIFFTNSHQNLLVWLLVCYIAFFGFSQGAVIWVYISEVFPNSVRSKGQALGSFTHWIMAAVVSWTFPVMAEKSGGYPFLFFASMMLLQFFVVKFIYVETKGKSLEALKKEIIR